MNILITSSGGDSAIAVIRILKETTDHKIFAIDSNSYASGFYLADQHFVVPEAKYNSYIPKIIKLVEKYKIDLIIPTVDEELLVLCLNLGKIPCQVVLSPLSTIILCQDKWHTIQELEKIIPTPEIYPLLMDITFPAIIKPRNSRGSRDIFLVGSKHEAIAVCNYLTFKYSSLDILFQEYLPGDEYTVDVLCDKKNKPIVIVPRLRIATKGGISTIGKTIKDKEIINLVKKITSKIPFYGPVNIQFKTDKLDELKLVEINPRFSGGLPITYESGINLPLLMIKIFLDEEIDPKELEWKEKFVYRYLQEATYDGI